MLFDAIFISQRVALGIKSLKKGKNMRKIIIGADSETCEGVPFLFQFYSNDDKNLTDLVWVNKNNAVEKFFSYLDSLPSNGNVYIMYGYNLQFDIISFFWNKKYEFLNGEEIDFEYGNYTVKGVYANVQFLIFYHKNSAKTIYLIDGYAFFPTSLKKVESDLLKLNLPKLPYPKGLGKKVFTKKDLKFVKYAIRDSEIHYYLGKRIDELHDEFNISQSVSRANMSGKIFRRLYVKKLIPQVDKSVMYASLHSYHGGKNGLYSNPGLYENVYGLDIISAYPSAMQNLPSFYNLECYKEITCKNYNSELPKYGIYRVSGILKRCIWSIFYKNSNSTIFTPEKEDREIKNYWCTSFELNEAIKRKEFILHELFGYFYDESEDDNISPWKMFAEDFFEYKNNAKNNLYREFYKVILNSLYGKTIELTPMSGDRELGYDCINDTVTFSDQRKAGGMFHPFIASLITGHCRAKLHALEHKYKAIHSSTDGIICLKKPHDIKGLGGIKSEFIEKILILRNKLYIIYTSDKNLSLKIDNKELK